MQLTSFIALFALALAGVEATGPSGKMPHQGDLTLGDFQALLDSEFMSQRRCAPDPKPATHTYPLVMASTSEDNGANQFSHCSSSATPRATTSTAEDDTEGVLDESEVGLGLLAATQKCTTKAKTSQTCNERACIDAGGWCKTVNKQCFTNFPTKSACNGCKCSRN